MSEDSDNKEIEDLEMPDEIEEDLDLPDDLDEELEELGKEPSKKKKLGSLISKFTAIFKKIFSSKKKILIIAAVFILLIILGAGAWFLFFSSGGEESSETVPTQEQMSEQKLKEEIVMFEDVVELEPFERLPLKPGSAMALISLNVSLELIDPGYRKQVYTLEDRIRKIIESQMGEMTWLELRSPEGKLKLKYSLLKRINSIFPKSMVRNIYFTFFIMQ